MTTSWHCTAVGPDSIQNIFLHVNGNTEIGVARAFCHDLICAFHSFAGLACDILHVGEMPDGVSQSIYISRDSRPPTETARKCMDETM